LGLVCRDLPKSTLQKPCTTPQIPRKHVKMAVFGTLLLDMRDFRRFFDFSRIEFYSRFFTKSSIFPHIQWDL
jgi:hypothetical protein